MAHQPKITGQALLQFVEAHRDDPEALAFAREMLAGGRSVTAEAKAQTASPFAAEEAENKFIKTQDERAKTAEDRIVQALVAREYARQYSADPDRFMSKGTEAPAMKQATEARAREQAMMYGDAAQARAARQSTNPRLSADYVPSATDLVEMERLLTSKGMGYGAGGMFDRGAPDVFKDDPQRREQITAATLHLADMTNSTPFEFAQGMRSYAAPSDKNNPMRSQQSYVVRRMLEQPGTGVSRDLARAVSEDKDTLDAISQALAARALPGASSYDMAKHAGGLLSGYVLETAGNHKVPPDDVAASLAKDKAYREAAIKYMLRGM